MPERIQLRRTGGWRKPPGAVTVARPTRWGNPFPVDGNWATWAAVALGFRADKPGRRAAAVTLYRGWVMSQAIRLDPLDVGGGSLEFLDGTTRTLGEHCTGIALLGMSIFPAPTLPDRPDPTELRGRDLACWCPLNDENGRPTPCHADVLLELANG